MRKLKPSEVVGLIAVFSIGNNNVFADEPQDELPTITVTGTINATPIFTVPIVIVPLTSPVPVPTYGGSSETPLQATAIKHAINCATAYAGGGAAGTPAGNRGPAPGYRTVYASDYGWTNSNSWIAAGPSAQPPATSGPWTMIDGYTSTNQKLTIIYGLSTDNRTPSGLIDTFVHELSHQWGASDYNSDPNYNATKIAAAAVALYNKEKGAKCGGL